MPGDDLVYTITFQNISDETAENVVITNPIAESLTYVNGSAFGPGASPGTTFAGLGDGGLDAIVGASSATAAVFGEYVVSDVGISMIKSVAISDPLGSTEPTVGATLTYTITTEVTSAGTATASVFADAIPAFTTFVANSIFLNGSNLTDGIDADVGELDTSSAPTVIVRLGDLTLADGIQTVEFQVTID